MPEHQTISLSGLRGWGQLAFDATEALTHVVEGMHHEIARRAPMLGTSQLEPMRGVTGLVYRSIRGTSRSLSTAYTALLDQLGDPAAAEKLSPGVEAVRAAANGLVGDHLAATHNSLAIAMHLRRQGRVLDLVPGGLGDALGEARRHVVVLVHGLCMTDLGWMRSGHDHGFALERDLDCTVTYLRYNSGLHISINGRALAAVLEALVRAWPVPLDRLTLIGHSMGGLVVRSACRLAERGRGAWLSRLRDLVFLGTPHFGAPLARGVHWANMALRVSPYTAALALLGRAWSAGAADLRHGYMLDEDWLGSDPGAPVLRPARPLPLPSEARCFVVAGCRERTGRLLGDGLVPFAGALGDSPDQRRSLSIPEERRWLANGVDHFGLLSDRAVYERIRTWLGPAPAASPRMG
jgi:pimeloyl-ACP methyl ester carboxylesterase